MYGAFLDHTQFVSRYYLITNFDFGSSIQSIKNIFICTLILITSTYSIQIVLLLNQIIIKEDG